MILRNGVQLLYYKRQDMECYYWISSIYVGKDQFYVAHNPKQCILLIYNNFTTIQTKCNHLYLQRLILLKEKYYNYQTVNFLNTQMISKRNYLNHAQLIDSERDTMRNQSMMSNQSNYYHPNNPPILSVNQPMISTNNNNFYRSPLRDRDNKINLSNTPLRSGKASLSPLRMRKADTSGSNNYANNSIRNTNRKAVNQDRESQQLCFNHPDKVSKFYVEAPDEMMYCCQKCAILLASQGFTVCKLGQSSPVQQSIRKQSNTRKQQIQSFMDSLSLLQKNLKSQQSGIQQSFSSAQHELQQQLNRIQQYYEQFYEFLNEHKKRVIFEMKQEYEKNNGQMTTLRKELKEAVQETESMKEDILQSWDDIIFVAEQHQYRPVIKAYLEKYQTYHNLLTDSSTMQLPEIRVRKLNFINSNSACEALEKGLQVQWEDQQKSQESEVQLQKKDEQDLCRYSKQSDLPQNPVECLQKDEKFIKSSLKDLVGLFSSFQQ